MKIVTIENKKEWDDLLSKCEKVCILQRWEYGEAKQNDEGWIPVRSVIVDEDKPIGVVQSLIKKIPLMGGIVRINRAPLIILTNHNSCNDSVIQILRFLHYYWVEQKRMILFIAPNILKDEIGHEKLQEVGYDNTNNNAWVSILVDLSLDVAILRKNLHQKWRNLLNKSERIGLELEIENSHNGLTFLLSKYNQMMAEKNFSGPSGKLIEEIKNVILDESSLQVMFAVKNGVRISGILIVGSADTCTYLIGWNSVEGRSLCSNYFLLWQAIIFFKKIGYHWFDLGGINEKLTPQITHFKRGLGGKEYTLIGEFWAFPQGLFFSVIKKIIKLAGKYPLLNRA